MIVQRGMPVDAMTHPLLRELLAMLPPPDAPFPRDRQRQWVEAAGAVLGLVYGDDIGDTDDVGEVDDVEDVDGQSANAVEWVDDGSDVHLDQPAESYNGSYNGAASRPPNGHEIAGRHRRPTFGRF
jgi:hypothetical protein